MFDVALAFPGKWGKAEAVDIYPSLATATCNSYIVWKPMSYSPDGYVSRPFKK
jgi:hypothetical protein